jgi:hypothetical protein
MRTVNVIEGIFFAALEKPSAVLRNAFLDEACTGDPELRRCVERMLDAQPKIGKFLERAAPAPPPSLATLFSIDLLSRWHNFIKSELIIAKLAASGFGRPIASR